MLKKNRQLCSICNESIKKKIDKQFNLNNTSVTDSRSTKNGTMIRRRRVCSCGSGHRFTTYERIHRPELAVVKRNGQIIPFNRERIFQSVRIALNGCIDQEKKTEQVSNEVNEKIQDLYTASSEETRQSSWQFASTKKQLVEYKIPTLGGAQDPRWKLRIMCATRIDNINVDLGFCRCRLTVRIYHLL